MKYNVFLSRRAEKEVLSLDDKTYSRIITVIFSLGDDPRPSGSRKLKVRDSLWRVRVGNFRIVYSIDDRVRIVGISRVSDRKDAYNGLQ